jgi:predicted DCC family thiol-disulfide oxidoreductase YuxK
VLERTGLSREEATAAAWTIADGTKVGGPRAVALMLAVAWQSRVPLLPFRVPGVGRLLDAVYTLIATNRHRFPGTTPWCVEHGGECVTPTDD